MTKSASGFTDVVCHILRHRSERLVEEGIEVFVTFALCCTRADDGVGSQSLNIPVCPVVGGRSNRRAAFKEGSCVCTY